MISKHPAISCLYLSSWSSVTFSWEWWWTFHVSTQSLALLSSWQHDPLHRQTAGEILTNPGAVPVVPVADFLFWYFCKQGRQLVWLPPVVTGVPSWGKNENKQWITVSYSPGTGPELNNINVRIMFPLSRYRGSGTNIWCNELLASHRLQPPAVSPSDVCHDVDVVCKASASYYYRSSYSHPTQNSQLKIYPQCKTGNVINE